MLIVSGITAVFSITMGNVFDGGHTIPYLSQNKPVAMWRTVNRIVDFEVRAVNGAWRRLTDLQLTV